MGHVYQLGVLRKAIGGTLAKVTANWLAIDSVRQRPTDRRDA